MTGTKRGIVSGIRWKDPTESKITHGRKKILAAVSREEIRKEEGGSNGENNVYFLLLRGGGGKMTGKKGVSISSS